MQREDGIADWESVVGCLVVVMMSDTFSLFLSPPFLLPCFLFCFRVSGSLSSPFFCPASLLLLLVSLALPLVRLSLSFVCFLIFNTFSVANVDGGVAERAVHSGGRVG